MKRKISDFNMCYSNYFNNLDNINITFDNISDMYNYTPSINNVIHLKNPSIEKLQDRDPKLIPHVSRKPPSFTSTEKLIKTQEKPEDRKYRPFDQTILKRNMVVKYVANPNNIAKNLKFTKEKSKMQSSDNDYHFSIIKDEILNNLDELCRNKIKEEYLRDSFYHCAGILCCILPKEGDDDCEIVAYAILSIVEFEKLTSFPKPYIPDDYFEMKYKTPPVRPYEYIESVFPEYVGKLDLLCAIEVLDQNKRETVKLSIGTYLQYQACRIFRDIYHLNYMCGQAASLSLLSHYMNVGFTFGIPISESRESEVPIDDDALIFDDIFKTMYNDFVRKYSKQRFIEISESSQDTEEDRLREEFGIYLRDDVFKQVHHHLVNDPRLLLMIDPNLKRVVDPKITDEEKILEEVSEYVNLYEEEVVDRIAEEIAERFVNFEQDLYLRFIPISESREPEIPLDPMSREEDMRDLMESLNRFSMREESQDITGMEKLKQYSMKRIFEFIKKTYFSKTESRGRLNFWRRR